MAAARLINMSGGWGTSFSATCCSVVHRPGANLDLLFAVLLANSPYVQESTRESSPRVFEPVAGSICHDGQSCLQVCKATSGW